MNSQINDEKFVYFLKIDFTVISNYAWAGFKWTGHRAPQINGDTILKPGLYLIQVEFKPNLGVKRRGI